MRVSRKSFRKYMATHPLMMPATARKKKSFNVIVARGGSVNSGRLPTNSRAVAVAITEETTTGTNDFKFNRPRITSTANTIPPSGALKIPPIAAAEPAAHRRRNWPVRNFSICPMPLPSEAPSRTVGASRPALPPELMDNAAVNIVFNDSTIDIRPSR